MEVSDLLDNTKKHTKLFFLCLIFIFSIIKSSHAIAQEKSDYEFYCKSLIEELFGDSRASELVNYFDSKYHSNELLEQLSILKEDLIKIKSEKNKMYITKIDNEELLPLYNIFLFDEDTKKKHYQIRIMFVDRDSFKMKRIVFYGEPKRNNNSNEDEEVFPPLPPPPPNEK